MIFFISFLAGTLSFFSPCILPVLPIYIGYLGLQNPEEKKKLAINTIFFSLGISFALFLLAFAFSTLGSFFNNYKNIIIKIGSLFIIILGLFQLGILKSDFLQKEKKLNPKIKKMNPFFAFILGFTFSFSWTPCIGPALSSILISIATLENLNHGILLIAFYTAGFILPFILTGFFSSILLGFIKKHEHIVKYTQKIMGVLIILIGLFSFFNSGNFKLKNYVKPVKISRSLKENNIEKSLAPDFNLKNQYGQTESLWKYRNKVIFLNFWASWCPPCKEEMPYIQELYEEYGKNKNDVIFLGVNNENPLVMKKFLAENGYTFPSVNDLDENVFINYQVSVFPTTFIIGKDGKISSYIFGGMTKEKMRSSIEKAIK